MIQMNTMPARASLVGRNLSLGLPLVAAEGNPSAAYQIVKRLMDVLGAAALIVALAPVLLTVLAVLTVATRGKPLFWQRRAARLGRPFMMAKFRTMRLDADKIKHTVANESSGPVFKNRNDSRVTRLGRFLRKTSLDETPQLFHVLLGQMSLVGPRPLERPRGGPLRALAAPPPGGEAGPDVPLAGERAKRYRLRGVVANGPLVRAEPEPFDGPQSSCADADEGAGLQRSILSGHFARCRSRTIDCPDPADNSSGTIHAALPILQIPSVPSRQ